MRASAISIGRHELRFAIGRRVLLRRKIQAAEVLGSLLALPEAPHVYDEVINAILAGCPDCECLYLDALPRDDSLWQLLSGRA